MNKLVVLATLIAIALFACKKDEPQNIDSTPIPEPKVSMMPLAVGNYWVYQECTVDSSNNVISTSAELDSFYISGYEVFDGDTFYALMKDNSLIIPPYSGATYLRDSSGYLINNTGYIYYSENNYTDTFRIDTVTFGLYKAYEYMANKNAEVTVPAGTFNQTATLLKAINFIPPDYPWGARRDSYYTYAKNVGIIKRRVFFTSQPDYIEFRLLRYHVNP